MSSTSASFLNNILVFLVVYLVYYVTLYPSVPGGDSGELLAEACVSVLIF